MVIEEIGNTFMERLPESYSSVESPPDTPNLVPLIEEDCLMIARRSLPNAWDAQLVRAEKQIFSPISGSPSFSLVLEWLPTNHDESISDEGDILSSDCCSWPLSVGTGRASPSLMSYKPCFETVHDRLLSHYCNNVIAIPWTNPASDLNPLRLLLPLIGDFVPLRNAVMALSATHYPMELSTCLTYKSQALSTFSEAIQDANNDVILGHLLATLLVLFNLHSVESGFGQWRVHLRGACQLLMARFRTEDVRLVLRQQSLLHSIVLQISWYDTAWAMMSLQACEIPDHFVRPAVLLSMENNCGGMADTVGCPESIYLIMRGIINGDITTVEEVFGSDPSSLSVLVSQEFSPSHATDRYCCEQAWKYGLVVYLVTKRREHVERAQFVEFCTNLVTIYTRNLSCSSFQKQLLLPVVIAGAQVDDIETRQCFREYCVRHRSEVKYALYEDGLNIMETTWTLRDEQKAKGLVPTACWADVTTHHPEKQYMLG